MDDKILINTNNDDFYVKKLKFIGLMQKIFGVLGIIQGAAACLGIITAIIGIPLIIAGVKLFKSGDLFSMAAYSNNEEFIKNAILNLAGYWFYTLIWAILIIIFWVGLIIFCMTILPYSYYYY